MKARSAWRRLGIAGLCLAAASWLVAAQPWLGGAAGAQPAPVSGIVRLHVVAHSDGEFDQAVKLRVRDRVLADLSEPGALAGAATPDQVLAVLEARAARLTSLAEEVLASHGAAYGARVEVGHHRYEERTYRDLTLPAGTYASVRVVLGSGRGANWWCVLYPVMCSVEPLLDPDRPGALPPEVILDPAGGEALLLPARIGPPSPAAVEAGLGAQPPVELRLALLDWARRWPALRQAVERLEAVLTHAVPMP